MEKKAASGIRVTLLLASVFGLALNTGLVKAETHPYYCNLKITVTPESPTPDDYVYVKVSFETASSSYIVTFHGGGFDVAVEITIPEVVTPETGYEEETFSLGKLPTDAYIFNVRILVHNFEGQELLHMWHNESFAVGAVPLPILFTPSITDSNLVPGSIFRINVTTDDVEHLFGYEFAIWYDTNVLTAVEYGSYPPFNYHIISGINDQEGWVAMAYITYIGDPTGFSTVDPYPIAWIDFHVDNIGASTLDFFYHSLFVNPGGSIPHERVNGFFANTITMDVAHNTLNLRSKGKWITVYIQLPEGYNPEDIDASTILLNETIQPVLDPKYGFVTNSREYLVDHNNDGIMERMVKFDLASVKALLSVGEATLTITGKVNDTPFEGSDTIKVIG